nr:MAG TPA: hypothetical protein [Caudoviricetes sp.]
MFRGPAFHQRNADQCRAPYSCYADCCYHLFTSRPAPGLSSCALALICRPVLHFRQKGCALS